MSARERLAGGGVDGTGGSARSLWLDLAIPAGLWISALLYFWPVLFGGETFGYRDSFALYYPQASLTASALRSGELPLWEPRLGLGYPFLADPHSMALYPLSALFAVLPVTTAYDWLVVLHYPLGGTFLFLLLRLWGLGRSASVLGALVYMYGGIMVSTSILTIVLRGLAWLPGVWLAFDHFLRIRSPLSLGACVMALAMQGTGSDPIYVALSMGGMFLIALRPGGMGRACSVGWALAASFCALLILACQYVPLAELISQASRAGGMAAEEALRYQVEPENLPGLVLPLPFPDPTTGMFLASFHGARAPLVPNMYFGWPFVALALTSLVWCRRRPRAEEDDSLEPVDTFRALAATAVVAAGASIVLALGDTSPLHAAVMWIPGSALVRYPAKWLFLGLPALCVAGALGLEAIGRDLPEARRVLVRLLVCGALGGAVIAALLHLRGEEIGLAFLVDGSEDLRSLWEASVPALVRTWIADLGFAAGLCLLLACIVGARGPWRLSPFVMGGLVCSLVGVDVLMATLASRGTVDERFLERKPEAVNRIAASRSDLAPPRIVSLRPEGLRAGPEVSFVHLLELNREILAHGFPACFDLAPFTAALPLDLRTSRIVIEALRDARDDSGAFERILASSGVTHAIFAPNLNAGDRLIDWFVKIKKRVVVRPISGALPRVFVAKRAVASREGAPGPDLEQMWALPETAYFDPGDSLEMNAILEPRRVTACRLVEYERRRLTAEVEVDGEGLLVVLDADYPGWRVRVDGELRLIFRVAGVWRGVPVRTGDRRVVMEYAPLSFRLGMALTALGSMALVALVIGAGQARHRAHRASRRA